MVRLKRIGVLSFAEVFGILMFIFGLIQSGPYIFLEKIVLPSANQILSNPLKGIGLFALLFFPIIYGIMGFVIGAIVALLYNLVAKLVGGVDAEFVEDSSETEQKLQEAQTS